MEGASPFDETPFWYRQGAGGIRLLGPFLRPSCNRPLVFREYVSLHVTPVGFGEPAIASRARLAAHVRSPFWLHLQPFRCVVVSHSGRACGVGGAACQCTRAGASPSRRPPSPLPPPPPPPPPLCFFFLLSPTTS